jgi:hypothetical protein
MAGHGGRGNHEVFTFARGKAFGGEQGGCGSGCHGMGKRRYEGVAEIRWTAPLAGAAVSSRAKHHLRMAGIVIACPGLHTLRYTCARRLDD